MHYFWGKTANPRAKWCKRMPKLMLACEPSSCMKTHTHARTLASTWQHAVMQSGVCSSSWLTRTDSVVRAMQTREKNTDFVTLQTTTTSSLPVDEQRGARKPSRRLFSRLMLCHFDGPAPRGAPEPPPTLLHCSNCTCLSVVMTLLLEPRRPSPTLRRACTCHGLFHLCAQVVSN